MENKFRFIECEGVEVAVYVEGHNTDEHPTYYPGNVLFYIEQGQFNIKLDRKLYAVPKNSFGLVKKYTSCSCFKTWDKDEAGTIMYAFMLQDEFIQDTIKEFTPQKITDIEERVFILKENKILKGLFNSLITYINENEDIDKRLVKLKTKEALLGILKSHPEYHSIFSQFIVSERADLAEFMNHNYLFNVPLEKLAQMSGRSLSTFQREFKNIYNETPHRWIMKMRLRKARELLILPPRKSSDIYIEVGFEDLAHFSRSFKKEFGKTPTEVKKEAN